MPLRRQKKNMKKKRTAKRTGKLISMPRVFAFKRQMEEYVDFSDPPSDWVTTLDNQIVRTFTYNLNDLPNHSEFVNLFSQYKLNYAVVEMFPNVSQMTSGYVAGGQAASNYIVSVWRNTHGVPLNAAFTRDELLEIQKKSTFMMPTTKPTVFKMPLKQLSATYASTLNTDYAVVKPRYINTTEDTTQHYGINVAISRVDGSAFNSNAPNCLVRSTILLTCKQVK